MQMFQVNKVIGVLTIYIIFVLLGNLYGVKEGRLKKENAFHNKNS